MEMNSGLKEVYFDQYCSKCQYFKNKDYEKPCHDCLNEPVNTYSHKPVKFEEKVKQED